MIKRNVNGRVGIDSSMEDGYVRTHVLDDGWLQDAFMTEATMLALAWSGTLNDVIAVAKTMPNDTTFLIPRSVIEREKAEEVERHLSLLDPGPSETCSLPHCVQDPIDVARGFPLCSTHVELLQDWDDLVE